MSESQLDVSAPSPAAKLRDTDPPDDSGAETFDRYEWQATMAAADVLSAYLECLDENGRARKGVTFEVICEHHEDWALSDGNATEIVSAKHKETQVGAFTTINSLLVDGGVLHLLDRWLALDRTPRCRLVTTAGIADDARKLVGASRALVDGTPNDEILDDILTKLSNAIVRARARYSRVAESNVTRPDRPTLVAFLTVLKIQDSKPARGYVALLAAAAYARPVAERLSSPAAESAIWAAVLGLVRERMRAAGPSPRGHLPRVLGARDEPGYEARTVTFDDVAVAIRVAIANQAGFQPLPRRIRTSKVAVKLSAGGCSDNTVERAESLRRQYRQHWREADATPSLNPTQRRVENVLLRVVDEATEVVRVDGDIWGPALWWEVQGRLDQMAQGFQADGLDADLLLGGVSELTNECRAWFSDSFDVDAEAVRLAQTASAPGPADSAGASGPTNVGGP